MPPVPDDEAKCRMVLDIFRKMTVAANHGVRIDHMVPDAVRMGYTNHDLIQGVNLGLEKGWFRVGSNELVFLTDEGHRQL